MTDNTLRIESEIVIIGAGLTGLTLAYQLIKAGKRVILIEKNSVIGGVIQTVKTPTHIYEKGPTTGVINHTALVQLLDELQVSENLEVLIPDEKAKNRWIWKANEWHSLPSSLWSAVTTPLFSFGDKLRILGEPFRAKGKDSMESIASMVRRRMGKSFLDYAVDPFVSGIYAGDPELLVTRYALPKLWALEQTYGSFVKGSIAKAKEPKSELEKKVTKSVFSVKGGLGKLIRALGNQVGKQNIYTSVENVSVDRVGDRYVVSANRKLKEKDAKTEVVQELRITADKLITTTEPAELEKILPFVSRELMSKLTNIRYAPVVQAVVNIERWYGRELNAFGGLIPTKENKSVLGVLFPSSLFPERAPSQGACLSLFLGGMKRPDLIHLSDTEIKQIVFRLIEDTMHNLQIPKNIQIFRYPRAIPQYEASTEPRLEAIQSIQSKYPGLILAGNMRDGIGMGDRVKQAFAIASELMNEN